MYVQLKLPIIFLQNCRFNSSNVLWSHINLCRIGQSLGIFCIAIRVSINTNDKIVSSLMIIPLVPQLCVSIPYYNADHSLEKWLIWLWFILSSGPNGDHIHCSLWNNCQIYEEAKEPAFMLMDYIVCGALLCPAFNSNNFSLHYIVDTVDADMFSCVNNWW